VQQLEQILTDHAEVAHGLFMQTYQGDNPAQKLIYLLNDLAQQHNNLCNRLMRKDLTLNGNMPTLRELSANFTKLQVIAESNKSNGVLDRIDNKLDDLLIRETAYLQAIEEIRELKGDLDGYHRVYAEMDSHLELYRDVVQDKLPEIEKQLVLLEKLAKAQENKIKEQGKHIKQLEALLAARTGSSKSHKKKLAVV